MRNEIKIDDLKAAIKDYTTAVIRARMYKRAYNYEDWLLTKCMCFGLCHYPKTVHGYPYEKTEDWTLKYYSNLNIVYIHDPAVDKRDIGKMKFCIEFRLNVLKWELGLRLAEQQLQKNDR